MAEPPKEARITLAIQAIERNQFPSLRAAAKQFNVPESSLRLRMAGISSRSETRPGIQLLSEVEEKAIVEYILDLDTRGFPPRISGVEDMANLLLKSRGARRVGKLWAERFIKRRNELRTRFSRVYDFQRALCENPDTINAWFRLVANMRAKYGIQDADFYNFDETGFMMGIIMAGMVVTGSERKGRRKKVQPGNREWATAINCANGEGWDLPPFLVVSGQHHLENWYTEGGLPPSWVVKTTSNGWTDNETGMEWIRHFDKYTAPRARALYRMLVLDGHESHQSVEFNAFCKERNIIPICLPPHSSHLTQPLDVGCFAPLKRAYGRQIESFIKSHINHITKVEFFLAFQAAYKETFTEKNIRAGFRGAGLVPHNPDAILSKLDVQIRTPTPTGLPLAEADPWVSRTPSNPTEALSQSTFVKERILAHQGSSPTGIFEACKSLAKGVELISHNLTLITAEVRELQKANEALSKRRRAAKTRVRKGGPLTVSDAQDIIDDRAITIQLVTETRAGGGRSRRMAATVRRCGNCGQPGHNMRTCQADAEETTEEDSD